VGAIITADAVGQVDWPGNLMNNSYYAAPASSPEQLAGMVVRAAITAGQPLTRGALVAPGNHGFLAAALSPGMRAITIPVSERSGVGGFISPGDRVDLMLTQTVHGDGGAGDQPLSVTETILRNLRVLATDQSAGADTSNSGPVVKSFHSVTLEVTPRIAEKIEVAQSVGTLSLTLRALADNPADLDSALASGAVTLPANASRQEEERLLAEATNRPSDDAPSYSTGGDVSRFQRRAMPRMGSPAPASGQAPAPAGASNGDHFGPPPPTGPMVRVTRGKDVTAVSVGGQ
jgi:pilus assembly protein CpaB